MLRRTAGSVALIFVTLILSGSLARAQTVDDGAYVTNGQVQAIAACGNTIYIAGTFTQVGPATGNAVPISLTTGAVGPTFPKADGIVRVVAADGSGGWFIGGDFVTVGGASRPHAAHIDADLTVTDWNPSVDGPVYAIVVRGATVYLAGDFNMVGGQVRGGLASVDAGTGTATMWQPNVPSYSGVFALATSTTTLFVGGSFRMSNPVRENLAAFDLNTGTLLPWNPGADSVGVRALAVRGATVYAGGYFTHAGGQSRHYAAAFDTATGIATPWNPAPNAPVMALDAEDAATYAGGSFTSIGGKSRVALAALDPVSGAAQPWNPDIHGSLVSAVLIQGATIYAAGIFYRVGELARPNIAAIDAISGSVTSWNPRSNGFVRSLAITGATLYAGGDFTSVGAEPRGGIAALDCATGALTAWDPQADGPVLALACHGTTVYAGGMFTHMGGQQRSYIAALDSASGSVMEWNPSANHSVRALLVSDTTLYVAGDFTVLHGLDRYRLAAFNVRSGVLTPWSPTVGGVANGAVYALAADSTTVFVGGDFYRSLLAVSARSGEVNTAWDPGTNGVVRALALRNTTLYVGGEFRSLGGQNRTGLGAVNAYSGVVDSAFPASDGWIAALAADASTVYVGSPQRLLAIDGDTGAIQPWSLTTKSTISAIATQGSSVLIGGSFKQIAGTSHSGFARVSAPPVQISIRDAAAREGNAGTKSLVFRITLSHAASVPVTVHVSTSDGTATAGSGDYMPVSTAVTFAPGDTSRSVDIAIVGDSVIESNESVFFDLSAAVGGTVARGRAVGTIIDDDDLTAVGPLDPMRSGLTSVAPNPSRGPIAIKFALAVRSRVRIDVLDVAGRRIVSLMDGMREAGRGAVTWDGLSSNGPAAPSLYMIRFNGGGRRETRRVLISR